MSGAGPEDAAALLADFVSSLDNLPSEVQHILQEIAHKEMKAADVRNRANARDQSIQRHARPVAQGGQGLLVPNPKEPQLVQKIRNDLDRAEAAAKEKVALSERGVKLLSRHLQRLQTQLELVTSDVPPLPTLPTFAPVMPLADAGYGQYGNTAGQQYGAGYSAAQQAYGIDKRRLGSPGQVPLLPAQINTQAGYGAPGNAASRVARPARLSGVTYSANGMPILNSLTAQTAASMTSQQIQQHLQQQQLQMAARAQALAAQQLVNQHQVAQLQAQGNKRKREDDYDHAEAGEEDGGEGEDLTPYCFCGRPSFGEMIGCDSSTCAIEWFHLSCVGLKTTPEGSWYCKDCEAKRKSSNSSRRKR
ncbi:hypothetical protein ACM66B_000966 [Microbotryomycetes sp. NB124-2]